MINDGLSISSLGKATSQSRLTLPRRRGGSRSLKDDAVIEGVLRTKTFLSQSDGGCLTSRTPGALTQSQMGGALQQQIVIVEPPEIFDLSEVEPSTMVLCIIIPVFFVFFILQTL